MTAQPEPLSRKEIADFSLASGEQLSPEVFPELTNLSAAFIYRYVPVPESPKPPEFAYVPMDRNSRLGDNDGTRVLVALSSWNMLWEAAQERPDFFAEELPPDLKWLLKYRDQNLYLIPDVAPHRYEAHMPLYHLLSHATLSRFKLPCFKRPIWPPFLPRRGIDLLMPNDFNERVSSAVAAHFWPLLCSGSKPSAFSDSEPLRVLAHNLSFWLPHAYAVAENRSRMFPRVQPEPDESTDKLDELRAGVPADVSVELPRMGGYLWCGEADAWDATIEVVERADSDGRLRGIIDAIRSNRVEEDFSDRWSYAREDFERKLYRKRSKVRVSFVELDDTIPVQGPMSELEDDVVWEDFLALLDPQERHVVVCLRNGRTNLTEIANDLGYANHSPVSKKLKRIREKARAYFDD